MEENQELIFKLSMFEQQIKQIQQQIHAVEQGIIEMSSLTLGLDELKGAKDKEILAPIGRGIFTETKLLSENLIVDVGGNNFVKKNIPETKELIQEQITKLEEVRTELEENLNHLNKEITQTITEAEKNKK